MKASTILKAFLVIAVIAIIGYIVYNSNKAAEINSLVNSTTKPYDFEAHVDSACAQISASKFKEAKPLYDKIYQEMDVYSSIVVDGAPYIDIEEQNSLFERCFEAYFPTIKTAADTLLNSDNWTPQKNKKLYDEIDRLASRNRNGKRGMNNDAKAKIDEYKSYFQGYYNLDNLLKNLANCQDSATYMTYEKLANYTNSPYNKLIDQQKRISKEPGIAKKHWRNVLEEEAKEILKDTIIFEFRNKKGSWESKVKSYENTTRDNTYFNTLKGEMQAHDESLFE